MRGKYWGQCCPNSRHGPPSRLLPGGHREWGHHVGGVFWKPYQEKELCDRPSYLRACGRTYSCFFPGCELSRPEPLILNNRLPVCLKKSSWGEKKKKTQHISCFALSLLEQIFLRSLLCASLVLVLPIQPPERAQAPALRKLTLSRREL